MSVNKLLDAIKEQREAGKTEKKFKGTFKDYLELVEKVMKKQVRITS